MTAKADRCRELIEDPHLQEAFENVRNYLIQLFTEADSQDVERLQDISKRLNLLEAVKADLEYAIEAGDFEDFKAQQEERNVRH